MAYFILTGILVVALIVSMYDGYNTGIAEAIFIGGFVGFMIGGVLSLILALIISFNCTPDYKEINAKPIVVLQDGKGSTGLFYLGSGRVDSTMTYTFMSKENDEYNMHEIEISQGSLIYSNDPKVVIYSNDYTSPKMKYWFWGSILADYKYKIYVPEGTIKQNYNVNLE